VGLFSSSASQPYQGFFANSKKETTKTQTTIQKTTPARCKIQLLHDYFLKLSDIINDLPDFHTRGA
jgi:hypothetical protein